MSNFIKEGQAILEHGGQASLPVSNKYNANLKTSISEYKKDIIVKETGRDACPTVFLEKPVVRAYLDDAQSKSLSYGGA